MAEFNWPSFKIRDNAPIPGVYTPSGFTNVGIFPTLPTSLNENTSNTFAYHPYDRITFAPRGGEDWSGRWGAYAYIQDKIYTNTSTSWTVVHTCTGQQNLLDYGIHTGLYTVWGRDGKAYRCGMYPATGANEVGGVIYDVENGTWTSFTQTTSSKFSNCTYPIAVRGRLALATEGTLYYMDPVNQEFELVGGPSGATDARDKLAIIGNRLFWVGLQGGVLKVWEELSTDWYFHTNIFDCPIGAGGDWALVQGLEKIGFVFYCGLQTDFVINTYFRHLSMELNSTSPITTVTITDVTGNSLGPIIALSSPTPRSDSVVVGCQEADKDFGDSAGSFIFVTAPTLASTFSPLETGSAGYLLGDADGPWGSGPGRPFGNYWTSNRHGFQDGILNRNERPTPYKIELANDVIPGGLKIHYYAHTQQNTLTMSSRVYYRDSTVSSITGDYGPLQPQRAGKIVSTDSGSLSGDGRTVDNVLMSKTGEDHFMVWDSQTDLGTLTETRLVGLSCIMNFPANLPPQ